MTDCAVFRFVRALKKPPPIIFVFGDEAQLINEARDAIAKASGASERERLSFAEFADMPPAGGSSLFGGSRLLDIVGHRSELVQGKLPKKESEALARIAARPAEGEVAVVSFYGLEQKQLGPKKDPAWLRDLHKSKNLVRAMRIGADATADWCRHWLPEMENDAASLIGGLAEGNLAAAKQAVIKMSLCGETTKESAARALSGGGRHTPFEVMDEALAHHAHHGTRALKKLSRLFAENEAPPFILWAAAQALQQLLAAKSGNSRGIFPWKRLDDIKKTAYKESEERLLELIRRAAQADRIVKGAGGLKTAEEKDAKILLTNLTVDLASAGGKSKIVLPGRD